ncbi:hypothetical protein ACTRXD_01330 [Nitrospira sp. T9]|uniref:hypothetical protein n=1 Tax=unclassified Nitrospira TaxID=2652172 RepID=UPI003F9E14FF
MGVEKLTEKVLKQDLAVRKMFADTLAENDFINSLKDDPESFHEILVLAKKRNWIHPTQLAKSLNLSDSNVYKWFQTHHEKDLRSTPNFPTMRSAIEALKNIINEDRKRIIKNQSPIGHTICRELAGAAR